jgi:hypothetical protein
MMRKLRLSFSEVLFIAVTHLVFGAGLALLASERLRAKNRRRLGRALTGIGIATGVPRVVLLRRGLKRARFPL